MTSTSSSTRPTPPTASSSRSVAPMRRSGAGLGLWEWQVGGGDATAIELPEAIGAGPSPSPGASDELALRAPRYAPDGQALAFVDLSGSVGMLELPAERLTLVPFAAAGAPIWMPDSSGVLITGSGASDDEPDPVFDAPVTPLAERPVRRGPPPLALGHLGRRAPLRRRVGSVRRRLRRPDPVRRSRRGVADRGQPERGAGRRRVDRAAGRRGRVRAERAGDGRRRIRRRRGCRLRRGRSTSTMERRRRSRRAAPTPAGSPDRSPALRANIPAPSLAGYVTRSSRRRFVFINPRL